VTSYLNGESRMHFQPNLLNSLTYAHASSRAKSLLSSPPSAERISRMRFMAALYTKSHFQLEAKDRTHHCLEPKCMAPYGCRADVGPQIRPHGIVAVFESNGGEGSNDKACRQSV
jgi:hypothetical protein